MAQSVLHLLHLNTNRAGHEGAPTRQDKQACNRHLHEWEALREKEKHRVAEAAPEGSFEAAFPVSSLD